MFLLPQYALWIILKSCWRTWPSHLTLLNFWGLSLSAKAIKAKEGHTNVHFQYNSYPHRIIFNKSMEHFHQWFHTFGLQIGWKEKFEYFKKIWSEFEFYSNLKGINSGRKKLLASPLMPQEGASSKIFPNACFFKVLLANMSKNSYLFILYLD